MKIPEIFDLKNLEADRRRQDLAIAAARLMSRATLDDKEDPINGAAKLMHTTNWNGGTDIITYAYSGSPESKYQLPTVIMQVKSDLVDYFGTAFSKAGISIEQSFDNYHNPISTSVKPIEYRIMFSRSTSIYKAASLAAKILRDFGSS